MVEAAQNRSLLRLTAKQLSCLWSYRELLRSLVIRDLRLKYGSSSLGFVWSLLHPLLMMSVYAIIFSVLIRQKVEGPYPLFLLAGILPWLFFAGSLTLTSPSLISNGMLINKVFFPREILPLAIIGTNLINLLLSLAVFVLFLLLFGYVPGSQILWLPLLLFCHLLFTAGISLCLSILNVYIRDIDHVVDIILQLWFFSVPVIYSMDFLKKLIGDTWMILYSCNPMVHFIVMYRETMLYNRPATPAQWLLIGAISIITFLVGYIVFKRWEFDAVKEI